MKKTTLEVYLKIAYLFLVINVLVHISTFLPFFKFSSGLFGFFNFIILAVVFSQAIRLYNKVNEKFPEDYEDELEESPYFDKYDIALWLYVAFNFFYTIYLKGGFTVDYEEGKYLLMDRGIVVKEVTENIYYKYEAYQLRLSSGHFLAFYSLIIKFMSSSIKTMDSENIIEIN